MVTVRQPELRKFTIAEYYKLAETGILAPVVLPMLEDHGSTIAPRQLLSDPQSAVNLIAIG